MNKTYKGSYRVKNKGKYEGDSSNVIYRSHWEKCCFQWCDENDNIKKWSSEEVVIPYLYEADKKYHRYFVDLKIVYNTGETVIVEVKPEKQTKPPRNKNTKSKRYIQEAFAYIKNMNKWEAANEYAADRGWSFQIWTEKTLREKGILKATPGNLKKATPYRKKKKAK